MAKGAASTKEDCFSFLETFGMVLPFHSLTQGRGAMKVCSIFSWGTCLLNFFFGSGCDNEI
jgi:hypothetical protein